MSGAKHDVWASQKMAEKLIILLYICALFIWNKDLETYDMKERMSLKTIQNNVNHKVHIIYILLSVKHYDI